MRARWRPRGRELSRAPRGLAAGICIIGVIAAGCGSQREESAASGTKGGENRARRFCEQPWVGPVGARALDPVLQLERTSVRAGYAMAARVENRGTSPVTLGEPYVERFRHGKWFVQRPAETTSTLGRTTVLEGGISPCFAVPAWAGWRSGRYRLVLPVEVRRTGRRPLGSHATAEFRIVDSG
jgi:hypothetical protein